MFSHPYSEFKQGGSNGGQGSQNGQFPINLQKSAYGHSSCGIVQPSNSPTAHTCLRSCNYLSHVRMLMIPVQVTCAARVHVEIVFLLCRNVNSVNLTASLPPFEPPCVECHCPPKCPFTFRPTRQGRPRTAREVVQRARVRKVALAEPARSMAPLTGRARVSPPAATACSSRRHGTAMRSFAYNPCCIDTRRWCRKSRFVSSLELINHRKFHTKVSGQHPVAYQPRRPTTNRARFRTHGVY